MRPTDDGGVTQVTLHIDNEERFCEQSDIAKVTRHIDLFGGGGTKLAFLLLSGSFNPVHTQHVRSLVVTRKYLEIIGWAVVGGFLAPSSDTQVQQKLAADGLSLKERIALCRLAVDGLDWLSVCVKGEFSSNWACRGVRSELERACGDILRGRRLTGVEIMGSDTVVRIFDKILMEHSSGTRGSAQQGRTVCCLLRPGPDKAAQRKHIESVLIPGSSELGVKLMIVEPTSSDPPLEQISSSAIRELVSKGEWESLRSKGWLAPSVLEALQLRASGG
ncbi:MAG TPA: hypothetical protein VJU84_01495 [Pyrinomonadaceae bacterium]|nr:hypothetical protein [Pyrinomonadaceae bacterium]